MNKHLRAKQFMLFVLLSLFCCVSIYAQEQTVTVNVKNVSLRDVFRIIEKQTTYRFSYRNALIDNRKDITISKEHSSVNSVLNEALRGRTLEYKVISSKLIVISDEVSPRQLEKSGEQGQKRKISGIVKDASGEPVIGASVIEKGTTNGIMTDMEGNFTLFVKPNSSIVISSVGYKTVQLMAENKSNFNVTLEEESKILNEVMVVGYAIGSKRTVSGSVENIKKEDMNKGVVSSPLEALKGKVAGVVIGQSGGDPMGTINIRIRGTSSLSGGNEPLVIIDGVFGDMSMLNALSPDDIASMTILKDASETAQYGSRGAAGVIVVSTEKGHSGINYTSVSYDGQFGTNSVFKNLKMLSADEYRAEAKSLGASFTDMKGNTNWLNEIERSNGITQNHNFSFTSGSDNSNMRASIGVIERQGALKNSDMMNYTAKFDATQYALNKNLKFELGIFGSQRDGNIQYDMQKMFYSAAAYNPTYPSVKNSSGVYDEDLLANEIYNPLGQCLILKKVYSIQKRLQLSVNIKSIKTWKIKRITKVGMKSHLN